jgi:hypothetical protein
MSRSITTEATTHSHRPDARSLEAFMSSNPVSVGVLAGVVTMAGQIAAQFDLPSHACRVTALAFAALLACYQVRVAQKRSVRESVLLVPIMSVIILTTGWGANGLIYESQSRSPVMRTAADGRNVSLLERLSELVIPSAQAAEAGANPDPQRDQERSQGGWKRW